MSVPLPEQYQSKIVPRDDDLAFPQTAARLTQHFPRTVGRRAEKQSFPPAACRGAAADDASASPAGNSRPEDYLLVPGDIALGDHVNHRVAITGTVSDAGAPPPPPPSANAAEKALKRLSVKAIKEVAANCAAAR